MIAAMVPENVVEKQNTLTAVSSGGYSPPTDGVDNSSILSRALQLESKLAKVKSKCEEVDTARSLKAEGGDHKGRMESSIPGGNSSLCIGSGSVSTDTENVVTGSGAAAAGRRKRNRSKKTKEKGQDEESGEDDSITGEQDGNTQLPMSRRERKNNREKQRRMEVNSMFERLMELLGMPKDSKSDKVRVLTGAIETIETLRNEVSLLHRCTSIITGANASDLGGMLMALGHQSGVKLPSMAGSFPQTSQHLASQFQNLPPARSGTPMPQHGSLFSGQGMPFSGYGIGMSQQLQPQSTQGASLSALQGQNSRPSQTLPPDMKGVDTKAVLAASDMQALLSFAQQNLQSKRKTTVTMGQQTSGKKVKATDAESTNA